MEPETLQIQRKRLGLTQQKLADHFGINRVTLARWESGDIAIPPYLERALRDLERELAVTKGRRSSKVFTPDQDN
jgi:transcriptional regulator with XRE-family HTH domain